MKPALFVVLFLGLGAACSSTPRESGSDAAVDRSGTAEAGAVDTPRTDVVSADVTPDVVRDAVVDGGGSEACPRVACGVTCLVAESCGQCGNGACDPGEDLSNCPADCCDRGACNPEAGAVYEAGAARCAGAADGTACSDDDVGNGQETCRRGVCRREPAQCRCPVTIGQRTDPPSDPELPLPPVPTDPAWVGTTPSDRVFPSAWGQRRIGVSRAWQTTRGVASLRVAVVDSGCDLRATDIASAVVAQHDFVHDDETAEDLEGHGTFLASIIAGRLDTNGSFGVAPQVSLVCAKVVDIERDAPMARVAAGIRWAIEQNARVVLVAMAGARSSPELEQAIELARSRDVVVVAPSGSGGGATLDAFPAALDGVISASASDRYDLPDQDADLGPRTALLAPGSGILAMSLGGEVQNRSGSSIAAAFVAGAAALVRSATPALNAAQVRALLRAIAKPIPHAEFTRFFIARRLDLEGLPDVTSPTYRNAAVVEALVESAPALPGSDVPLRVVVENRGAVALENVSVRAVAGAGAVTFEGASGAVAQVAALPVGETAVLVARAAFLGANTRVTFTVNASGDTRSVDDTLSVEVAHAATVTHALRIAGASIEPSPTRADSFTARVTVENVGNVPEAPGRVLFAHDRAESITEREFRQLAPGEYATVEYPVRYLDDTETRRTVVVALRPADGQADAASCVAQLNFYQSSGDPHANLAYFQLNGPNLIADAPWRTVRDRIPVLFYFARTHWNALDTSVAGRVINRYFGSFVPDLVSMHSVTVRSPGSPSVGTGVVLYQQRWSGASSSNPTTTTSGLTLVDEDGVNDPSLRVITARSPVDGSHRVLWMPRSALSVAGAGGMLDPGAVGGFIDVEFLYKTRLIVPSFHRATRKMLAIEVGPAPPRLAADHHYIDPHFHTIAEWYTGNALNGPAKAYGGPLEMLAATAWSLGYITTPTFSAISPGTLYTSDHNTFFGDSDAPGAGPTTRSRWSGSGSVGSAEFSIMRNRVGSSAGEEVTVGGSGAGRLGRHTLVFGSSHVAGAWGPVGGGVANLDTVLVGLTSQGEGFAYAAHPMASNFEWGDALLRTSMSLPVTSSDRRYVRSATDEFVFAGYQLWNTRITRAVGSSAFSSEFLSHTPFADPRDVNPFRGATSQIGGYLTWSCRGDYHPEINRTFDSYMENLRDGLEFSFSTDPLPRNYFVRKGYFVAGSDAHGDFNYTTDLMSTVVASVVGHGTVASVSDGAYGRPRTYVLGDRFADVHHGRSIATDGPILEVEIDAEGRGELDSAGTSPSYAFQTWHDGAASFHDREGLIGGDGRFDGSRSFFLPVATWEPPSGTEYLEPGVVVRARCMNSPEFGGTTPTVFELISSGEPDDTETHAIRLMPFGCNGSWNEQVVQLPEEIEPDPEDVVGPVALVGHLRFDGGCSGTYDAWANPIWALPVTAPTFPIHEWQLDRNQIRFDGGDATSESSATVEFPISMMAEPVDVRLMQISPGGTLIPMTTGAGAALGPLELAPSASSGWTNSDDGERTNTKLSFFLPLTSVGSSYPLRRVLGRNYFSEDRIQEHRFVLLIERRGSDHRLRDIFGNPIGVVLLRFAPRPSRG